MQRMCSTHRFTIGIVLGLLLGVGAGYELFAYLQTPLLGIPALREEMTNYRLIDPLLACNSREATTGRYKELDDSLKKVVADIKASGDADDVSVYFQEYPTGRWVGIDQDHEYNPASLLKIVLMIAYLKDEELHPGAFEKKYVFTPELQKINSSIPYDSTSTLVVGKTYGVEELISAMIIDSDNGAKDVLLDNVDETTIAQVYSDLKIPAPEDDGEVYTISPKEYSLFFRILYNATYLTRANSEKAMNYLAQATYTDGLRAGIPKSLTVAHKFGEHVTTDTNNEIASIELHDCGIVYGSNLPYFICVMTSGKSLDGLKESIKQISSVVFNSVDTTQAIK